MNMRVKTKKPKALKPVRTVTIVRKRWGTGSLRNVDGSQCCLGFCARAAGYKPSEILNEGTGQDLQIEARYFMESSAIFGDSSARVARAVRNSTAFSEAFPELTAERQDRAAYVNDSIALTRPEKEKKLKSLFKSWGIRLVFKD